MIRINLFLVFFSLLLPKESFNLLSFNIQGFNSNKNLEKISEIIDNVKDFDILTLQENWSYRNKFLEKIKRFNSILDKSKNIFNSTGLTILFNKSINIVEHEIINFSHCNGYFLNGSDCLASKGFIFARINLSGNFLDIYNTHLDAGNCKKDQSARTLQLSELQKYIKNKNSNYPIIITGDFNIDYNSSESETIKNFIDNLDLDFVKWDKKYFLDNNVDYIFFNNINQSNEWLINNNIYNISDHPPMRTMLEFKQ